MLWAGGCSQIGTMTTLRWEHDGVRVVPSNEFDGNTPQTPGMERAAAITFAKVGASKLWAGTVHIHPGAKTGAHHHGEIETWSAAEMAPTERGPVSAIWRATTGARPSCPGLVPMGLVLVL